MKSSNIFTLVAVLSLWAVFARGQIYGAGGAGGDTLTTLTIKADGSCVLTAETVQPRKMMELQTRSWERYSKMRDGAEDEDENSPVPPAQPPKAEQTTLSDDDLAKKIREMYETRLDSGGEDGQKIQTLEVMTNSVRVVTGRAFGSLKELLGETVWSWGPSMLMIENARFETETNGQLRVTFTPSKESERYSKNMARQWKATKIKVEWKLVLPGKVVSSGLPETKDNATWVALDSSKPESIDATLKIIGSPIVITAQPAGIKLDAALESKNLIRAGRRGSRDQPDTPITDAGPGFVAEPISVAVSTTYHFPGAEKYLKDRQFDNYGMGTTGTVVTAKLFPPKGRTIRSVSGVRVLKAKDDKGRALAGAGGEDGDNETASREMDYEFGGSDRAGVARLDLRMGLPSGDAQTIEEVEAEGIVFSIGGWKELTLTNVQADTNKEIDLGELVPGAKLIITKVTARKPQTTIQARLLGPAAVDQLDVKLKLNDRNSSSSMSERRSTKTGGKTTRTITVQGYEFDMERGSSTSPTTLIVRLPQDSRRERVRFKLTALDLL